MCGRQARCGIALVEMKDFEMARNINWQSYGKQSLHLNVDFDTTLSLLIPSSYQKSNTNA